MRVFQEVKIGSEKGSPGFTGVTRWAGDEVAENLKTN
jgi:hypothetical protein